MSHSATRSSYETEAADISGRFGRGGFIAHSCKADTSDLSRDSHPGQPVDSTMLSTVRVMPVLSESEHSDRLKEASDTPIGNIARIVLDPLVVSVPPFSIPSRPEKICSPR